LDESYEYIGLLEDSDIQLRTAVALVSKQNKALSGVNAKLKQQLGEANAALAMQQFYNDLGDEDLDGDIELLSSALKQRDDDDGDDEEDNIPAPPPPPEELVSILSTIPNYVAEKRKMRAEAAEKEAGDPIEMADLFAKALLKRRDHIDDASADYSSGDEWDDDSE